MIKVATVSLPPQKSAGGIDSAIAGIESAVSGDSIKFTTNIDEADIVHFHGLWQWDHAKKSKKLREQNKAYIVSPHGMLEPWAFDSKGWKKKPYFHFIESKHLSASTAMMVTSELEKRNVAKHIDHPNIEICPLGCSDVQRPDYLEARKHLNWSEDELVLLYLSRLDPKKGMHLLLPALANAQSSKKKKVRLVVVGDGDSDYVERLKKMENSLSDQLPKIDWQGAIWGEKRWSYLQGADLFCLPTHSENFGIAVLEALHVGTPVLTSDQTPWADHREEKGFFIIKPEIESIGKGLEKFFDSTKILMKERSELSDWSERLFSWNALAKRYEDVYMRILNR